MFGWNFFKVAIMLALTLAPLASEANNTPEANPDVSLNPSQYDQAYNSPLFFTENKGQWDDRVLFKADGAGGLTWWIERDGFTVLFSVPSDLSLTAQTTRSHTLKFQFQNASVKFAGDFLSDYSAPASAASFETFERLPWNNNYFLGNDPSRRAPDCGNYQRVVLKDVWEGVDVVWRGVGKTVEFDFIIPPGADVNQIRVECLGLTEELSLCEMDEIDEMDTVDVVDRVDRVDRKRSELALGTSLGELRMALPEAYQIEEDGSLTLVLAEFAVVGEHAFGVALPEGYDSAKPLVLDPLVYSTYLGGNQSEKAYALAPDGEEGIVVAGYIWSEDFPTTEGAFDETYNGDDEGNWDSFVARFSEDGSELIYSTFLGGEERDNVFALAADGLGGVIAAGNIGSEGFPVTENAFDRSYNGRDIFISQLNDDGSELLFSTFFGGEGADDVFAMVFDGKAEFILRDTQEARISRLLKMRLTPRTTARGILETPLLPGSPS